MKIFILTINLVNELILGIKLSVHLEYLYINKSSYVKVKKK